MNKSSYSFLQFNMHKDGMKNISLSPNTLVDQYQDRWWKNKEGFEPPDLTYVYTNTAEIGYQIMTQVKLEPNMPVIQVLKALFLKANYE